METGIERIAAERQRQIDVEGWTPEHDAKHEFSELLEAATAYLTRGLACAYGENCVTFSNVRPGPPRDWPWKKEDWKPSDDAVRNLEKAGALIAAEIDRLQA